MKDNEIPGSKPTGIPVVYPINTYTHRSSKRLAELGFDPLEKMVRLHFKIGVEIEDMKAIREAGGRISNQLLVDLMNTQQKICNDLLRYGYSRVSETVTVEHTDKAPLMVTLTEEGQVYEHEKIVDMVEEENDGYQ